MDAFGLREGEAVTVFWQLKAGKEGCDGRFHTIVDEAVGSEA
ncbi:hypothetical protein [Acidocella sp.]